MLKIINYFRGNIETEIYCAFPERFLNICYENNIPIWDIRKKSEETLTVKMHFTSYRKLQKFIDRSLFEVRIVKKRGVPFLAKGLKKRYVFWAGVSFFCIALAIMSQFIWDINISGNQTIPSEKILLALDEIGVGIGTYGPGIDSEIIRNEMLLKIDELIWITVNVSGSHAEIIVRERTKPPEVNDVNSPANIVADKSGIITKIEVLAGEALVEKGDTVAAGDTLITGILKDRQEEERYVRAASNIYARTWYTLSAEIPLVYYEKEYSGEEKDLHSIIIGSKKINLYFNGGNSLTNYDKIIKKSNTTLAGGISFPFKRVTETYREYELVKQVLDLNKAKTILQSGLEKDLLSDIDGEVIDTEFVWENKGDILTMTMYAECLENIAKTVEFSIN